MNALRAPAQALPSVSASAPQAPSVGPGLRLPALVVGSVRHTRYRPRRHSFTYGHYQWLVDLDDPPQMPRGLGWLGTLRPEDHLGSPTSFPALRAEVLDAVAAAGLAAEFVERVVMLAHARILGHVFDPMSAFWCLDADGRVVAVLVEVHNTYAGRHAYVVEPDPGWRAEVDKELFVSPFNDTSGRYLLHLELTPDRVVAVVRLVRDGSPVVTAAVQGVPVALTPRRLAMTAARHPLMTQRVSALIRVHGIWLWARRLPMYTKAFGGPKAERSSAAGTRAA